MKKTFGVIRARSTTLLLMFTVILLASTGCGNQEPQEQPTLDLDSILNSTSEFQKAILEDGNVTAAEYEMALLAYRGCVQDAGATVGEIVAIGNNAKTFSYEIVAANEEQGNAINSKADACLPEYYSEVSQMWAFQQVLSPEQKEEVRPQVISCLSDSGVSINDDATFDDIIKEINKEENVSRSQECIGKFPEYFAVTGLE